MRTRVNKTNRPGIMRHVRDRFNAASLTKSGGGPGKVSIIDIWDAQFEIEKLFHISDYQSQKLTWAVIEEQSAK
jgi:hypothetical protein